MTEQIVISKVEKPNSFETGKAGARWKLYFNDASDLKEQVEQLEAVGFKVLQEEEKDKEE